MTYSFLEPEWPADCECKYDEARDEMDREDCPFHCDMTHQAAEEERRVSEVLSKLRRPRRFVPGIPGTAGEHL